MSTTQDNTYTTTQVANCGVGEILSAWTRQAQTNQKKKNYTQTGCSMALREFSSVEAERGDRHDVIHPPTSTEIRYPCYAYVEAFGRLKTGLKRRERESSNASIRCWLVPTSDK